MPRPIGRRALMKTVAATAAALPLFAPLRAALADDPGLKYGESKPFSFDALIARARQMSAQPYQPPYRPAPEITHQIDYEAHGKIRYRGDHALFGDGSSVYPLMFFHLGRYFQKSVKMHRLTGDQAQEILYSPSYFDMPADSVARQLPTDSGFAGFRIHESNKREDWRTQDWIAFLGASYFRSIGALQQYGLSARGVAVDTASQGPEEFPDFTEFYIGPTAEENEPFTIYTLLDGPGLTGAFKFVIRRTSGAVMDIENHLFLRRDMFRLGISPLTSMFWFGEYNRPEEFDWRPEVHDSDGLSLWTGTGERIWRPLNNPRRVAVSSFVDENPKGFGLAQRDRDREHYLDGVNYERRPTLWVEPLDAWGRGSVQLIEIPTDDEIHDNIVAAWVPEQPAKAGDALSYRYRLHWLGDEPFADRSIARVVATRVGRGGEPGKPRPEGVTKFVVELASPLLEFIGRYEKPEPVITSSRGEISYVFTEPVPGTTRWRVQFDLTALGAEPVELRMFIRKDGKALSETWLYQYNPRV
jgi:periplasmic glucans biosynthesis protein